ncbi:MAG: ATP-dependent sacrificial sulfur transferase LarE [Nitrososphaeria archaeon]
MEEVLSNKLNTLKRNIGKIEKLAVAFSGGVDSTFLLKVAADVLTKNNVIAITVKSPLIPQSEFTESVQLAEAIGTKQIIIDTENELFENENIKNNKYDRCYYCKKINFSKIVDLSRTLGFGFVADGSNFDDIKDYRPGFKALYELGIISPLIDAHLTKSEIRELSKELKLSTYDKPAFACLATRFSYNTSVTYELLNRVETTEEFIKQFNIRQLRVRDHKDTARIEVLPEDFNKILEYRETIIKKFRELGYKYISLDIEGYDTGKMNRQLEK